MHHRRLTTFTSERIHIARAHMYVTFLFSFTHDSVHIGSEKRVHAGNTYHYSRRFLRKIIDDFFSTNHYKGDIYMTTNMQNKSLQQYCATDSLLKKEQNRIEKQISDFEEHIWATPIDSVEQARLDSIAAASVKGKKGKADKASASAARSSRRASASGQKEKSGGRSSSSNSGAPRVSVRRQ